MCRLQFCKIIQKLLVISSFSFEQRGLLIVIAIDHWVRVLKSNDSRDDCSHNNNQWPTNDQPEIRFAPPSSVLIGLTGDSG